MAACRSLDLSTHKRFEIIIVDNASSDDSVQQLRAAIPGAHIIPNDANAGFAGGCNVGIRQAIELGCEYIFLLNNDALAESETLTNLIKASRNKDDSALLGSAVVYASSGTYQFFGSRTGSSSGEPEFMTTANDEALLSLDFIDSDFIAGAAFFIPVRLLGRIGQFDERFFLNYEETDFCYRARKLGIPCFVVPASLVHHHANVSMGSYPAPMQAYFLARNSLLFAEKHATPMELQAIFRLKKLYWDIRRAWKSTKRKHLTALAVLHAHADYHLGRFGDCPARIRRMDASYREAAHAEVEH